MSGTKPPRDRTISLSTSKKRSRRVSLASGIDNRCAGCRKTPKHAIIEIDKNYVWCKRCWREYMKDVRDSA